MSIFQPRSQIVDNVNQRIEQFDSIRARVGEDFSSASTSLTTAFRDLGVLPIGTKPDGSPASVLPSSSSLITGLAERLTGKKEESAADTIVNGNSSLEEKTKDRVHSKSGSKFEKLVANPLLKFASYSPMWTMACLTKDQFNNPALYRNKDSALKGVIFSSGGRYDSQRAKTASGVPEYFVNNFQVISIISATPKTGNQNSIKFSFEIIEPFSMGLLLQSMQVSALQNNYANYLDNAPYVLKLEFLGYDELMNVYKVVKPKYFVMKLTSVKFDVNEGGSRYKVEGIPYNHIGFSDVHNITYTDMKLTGGSIKEACDNLTKVLNDNEKILVSEKKINFPDEYVIEFPTEAEVSQVFSKPAPEATSAVTDPGEVPGVTVASSSLPASSRPVDYDPNDIGASVFGFDASSGGNFVFGFERDKTDPETGKIQRDKVTIDPTRREFLFAQKQSLTDIMVQLVISSRYAKDALDPRRLTDEGFIRWFKLDVQVQFLEYDTKIGDFSRKIIYRIVPYLVHHSIFSNPNSVPYGYKQLEKQIVKKYEYIYTGQNVDVLKFDIAINNLFYTGTNPNPEANSANIQNQDQTGTAPKPGKTVAIGEGTAPEAQLAYSGRRRTYRSPELLDKENKGGSGNTDTEQKVAESFHKAFLNGSSADLITVDLETLGDTYWLVDSGIANYYDKPQAGSSQITEDGSANYQGSDVYIYIVFRTPSDVNPATGLYAWPAKGKISPFTGIYRVTMVESYFSDGHFKQKLKCLRMPLQSFDFEGDPPRPNKESSGLASVEQEKKQVSTLLQTGAPSFSFDLFSGFDLPTLIPSAPTPQSISGIDRFVNSLGDPNAPPYTGDDPIVRARLGLPPLDESDI